ncbi:protein adenylyltransferase SelO [Mongoliitalea daihaiensis]|uniref:protein adenylyltransferase SelO n=1 Tax=Mongoliitalea daihaiensis TaxID=2782006 RepID=UPI001F3DCBD2|nr:YdiU family protein [Mongoliitalea daihaiensis]UJP65654.1 YdiU family protein [Mongoliitalea daihaiensis]
MSAAIQFNFDTTYTNLPSFFFSEVVPTAVANPQLVLLNQGLAQRLGIPFDENRISEIGKILSGNTLIPETTPLAQAYAGHQFGNFTMLGDGRAILLGEQISPQGERYDIQLKGAGRTPYSRGGDGRAHFAAMLREYLMSEALHYLRIPTSRSLAVVWTGEPVYRERTRPGAVLTRVAKSHLRVGTFEYAKNFQGGAYLQDLLNYAIARHFPDLDESENKAIAFFEQVMELQAALIVDWMRVGFIHGVMNTDNMCIAGETIDYGPCAFMNAYEPKTVFSSIDTQGRYAYGNQPYIAHWNLSCLISALLPAISSNKEEAVKLAEASLQKFPAFYEAQWLDMMRSKLGLTQVDVKDKQLIDRLLGWMQGQKADFTNTFFYLQEGIFPDTATYQSSILEEWISDWEQRIAKENRSKADAQTTMRNVNPAFIPRNHRVEAALSAAEKGDMEPFHQLLEVIQQPYLFRPSLESYQEVPESFDENYQTFCGT